MRVLLNELRWPEVGERMAAGALAVLPLASTEQHGPHLPLGTDATIVSETARRAAEAVAGTVPVLLAPTVTVGFSEHHMGFPGTLTLSVPTFIAVVTETCESLVRHGCRKLLLLNGHGGNHELAQVVVRQMVARHELAIGAASYWDVALAALHRVGAEALGLIPGHSAGFETTCMLALRPDLVALDAMPDVDQSLPGPRDLRRSLQGMVVMSAPHRDQHGESGVWGDPALLRRELGPLVIDAIVGALEELFVAFARSEGY
jgi:creatinine amidohydrolase